MILPLFRKKKLFLPLLHPKNASFFYIHPFSSSPTASKTQNPSPKSNPIAEYLIKSCGLSRQKAASASKFIPKITSVEQANSVRLFFKHHGFDDCSIRKVISNCPRILSVDVEKTLQPNLKTLHEMGFTATDLEVLFASNAYVLVNPLVISCLEYWQTFLRINSWKDLVSVFTTNRRLIAHNIASGITPKISLLKEHGLTKTDIVGIVKRGHCIITRSCKKIEAALKSTKELGLDPKSGMFGQVLSSLGTFGSGSLEAKKGILKGFGWSETELLAALRKTPFLFHLSEENIREKMDFLVGRAGCERPYIASNPWLLMFSLKKRLKPRHYVKEVLKSNGIVGTAHLYSIMCLPEKKFVESIILPYKEQVPNIHEIYIAACDGQIPN